MSCLQNDFSVCYIFRHAYDASSARVDIILQSKIVSVSQLAIILTRNESLHVSFHFCCSFERRRQLPRGERREETAENCRRIDGHVTLTLDVMQDQFSFGLLAPARISCCTLRIGSENLPKISYMKLLRCMHVYYDV